MKRCWFCLSLFAVMFATDVPAWAQRDLRDIPPPDPAIEQASFQVAEGFEINLYAADPLLAKPIQMNFDEQGRLWVATSEVYPHILPGQQANDKIIVLEDRDADGVAERTNVFAEGLLIPTAVIPGDGGAYVANSTELLHMADPDGDLKADSQRVVLSGFGTEDTHHILHTLRWGPDGQLYFNQSIYIHSHIETPHGVRRLNAGGIWEFRPETMQLEVFIRGLVNPWGHHFDRWGQSFVTDGAGGEGINYAFPDAIYFTAAGAERIVHGLNPGSPKHCSAEIIGGRHMPDDWQGSIITNDFRAHRVCRFVLTEQGAGFMSVEQPEVVKSTHVAFRPVDVKQGPDGAIYIADWYNPIIQHGEVDFRDPRRDHTHGRIWRVTAKGRPLVERPRLAEAATGELFEQLKSPEPWTRLHAKRVLKSRGKSIAPDLHTWVDELDPSDAEFEHHRLEALWTYQSIDVVEPELLTAVLSSPDYHARAAATRVLAHWHTRLEDPLGDLAVLVVDDHPRVRLEAVCALGRIGSLRSADLAMRALDRPLDEFLDFALWNTARELQPFWLPAVQAGRFNFSGNIRHLMFALDAVGSPEVLGPIVRLLDEGQIPPEQEEGVLGLVAAIGGPEELRIVFENSVLADEVPIDRRARALRSLAEAARGRKVRPTGNRNRLVPLIQNDDVRLRTAAMETAGGWRLAAAREALEAVASGRDDVTSEEKRTALFALASLGGKRSRAFLIEASRNGDDKARGHSVEALADVDLKAAAAEAVRIAATLDPAVYDPASMFATLVHRQGGPKLLAESLATAELPEDVAKIGIRAARLSGRDQTELVNAFRAAGKLTGQPVTVSPDELQSLIAEIADRGEAARGEAVFRREELACQKCHAIGGAGGQVGPDLSSIGASAQVDYLIESILTPSKIVKENYHSLVVATDDGRVYTGIKIRETKDRLVLRDADDHEVTIAVDSIEEQAPGRSLMPSGLVDSLTRDELVDLVRFLAELGKVGPFAVDQSRVVRRWQVLPDTEDVVYRLRRTSFATAALEPERFPWQAAYSTVAGELPLAALPALKVRDSLPATGFARFDVDVATRGVLRLALNDTTGLLLWIDTEPIRVETEMDFELDAGRHTLTLSVDLIERKSPLRCELVDAPGSTAQAHRIGGK